jgi:transcriptional repressor NrdR
MEDKVVDSRLAEDGGAIRRRRECLGCTRRYTTYERAEEVPLILVKRSGDEEPFDRTKIVDGVRRSIKNRPITEGDLEALAEDVEETVRDMGVRPVPSAEVGRLVLDRLQVLDEVAYLRFASVYKDFQELTDFERELGLLQKKMPPKDREEAP